MLIFLCVLHTLPQGKDIKLCVLRAHNFRYFISNFHLFEAAKVLASAFAVVQSTAEESGCCIGCCGRYDSLNQVLTPLLVRCVRRLPDTQPQEVRELDLGTRMLSPWHCSKSFSCHGP